jgi:hypothetical protein
MANGFKKGGEGNVDSGSGSKSGLQSSDSNGIGKGKVAKTEKQHDATSEFAQGGDTHMFGEQAAGEQKPATTAHDVKGGAPGAEFAKGGSTKMFGYEGSKPAQSGITSAR